MDCTSIEISRGDFCESLLCSVESKSTLVMRDKVVDDRDSSGMKGSDFFSGA